MTPRDRDLRLLPAGKAGWPFSSARRPGALVSTVQGPSSIGVTPGPDLALPGDLATDLNLPGIGLSCRGMASVPRGCSCWRLRLSGLMASVPSSSARGASAERGSRLFLRNAAFGTGCRGWAGTIGAGGGGGGAGSASREAFGAALLFGRSNDLGFTGGAALLFGRSSDLGSTVGGLTLSALCDSSSLMIPLSIFTFRLLVLSLSSFSRHLPRTGFGGGGDGSGGPPSSSLAFCISSSRAISSSFNLWSIRLRLCNCLALLRRPLTTGFLSLGSGREASAIS